MESARIAVLLIGDHHLEMTSGDWIQVLIETNCKVLSRIPDQLPLPEETKPLVSLCGHPAGLRLVCLVHAVEVGTDSRLRLGQTVRGQRRRVGD